MRVLFGKPGRPLSIRALRRLRTEGVGPLLGHRVKSAIPCIQINQRCYHYPKPQVDELLAELRKLAKTQL